MNFHFKCIAKISQAFKRYARNYRFELIGSQDPLAQLEAGKLSVMIFHPIFCDTLKGPAKIGHSFPSLSFSCRCFVDRNI